MLCVAIVSEQTRLAQVYIPGYDNLPVVGEVVKVPGESTFLLVEKVEIPASRYDWHTIEGKILKCRDMGV